MKNLTTLELSRQQAWAIRAGSEESSDSSEETTAEVTVNKAKMADKAFNAITQYISS